jgi:quercetin dioxygenase-like cupin family protein
MEKRFARMDEQPARENPEGIFRTTLAYNGGLMLCRFFMKKGAKVPIHDHPAAQIGYVIKGKVRFHRGGDDDFTAHAGCSYVFDGGEPHGADVLEEAEVIECFSPMRPEYTDMEASAGESPGPVRSAS